MSSKILYHIIFEFFANDITFILNQIGLVRRLINVFLVHAKISIFLYRAEISFVVVHARRELEKLQHIFIFKLRCRRFESENTQEHLVVWTYIIYELFVPLIDFFLHIHFNIVVPDHLIYTVLILILNETHTLQAFFAVSIDVLEKILILLLSLLV